MIFERMYGTVSTVSVPLIAFSTTSFHNSVTSTMFSAGDTKISKNYGGFTNTATTPTGDPSNFMMVLSLTAAEMQAAHIEIRIVDSVTKVWEDQMVVIETYGTTSAQHVFNRDQSAVQASLTAAQNGVTIATVTQVTNQVVASLTANQTGVTIATVTQVTNQVVASLTANQAGVTIATVSDITNTVKASLTAAQTGVTVATVTNVTNGVNLTTTAILNNLAASATAQINAEVDTALADASVTAVAMNKIHSPTDAASAIFTATVTSTSFNTDTVGERLTSIDNKLPSGSISGFDPLATTVSASLTAAQNGVTIATVTQVTNQVIASLTAAQTGVTIATVTDVTNGVNLTSTTIVNNLGASATAQINAEVVDVVNVDTISELAQAAPAATPTMRQALMLPYMALRNKVTVDSSAKKFFNDAGTNVITKSLSDDATTYTEAEAGAGS